MKKILYKLPQIIIIVGLFAFIAFNEGRIFNFEIDLNKKNEEVDDSLKVFREMYPNHKFKANSSSETVYVVDSKGEVVAELLFTMPYCSDIKGYGGNIPFVIILNANKKIDQLVLLKNHETPRWIKNMRNIGFFDEWNNLSVKEAINKKVDAISGSTITSNCIIHSLQKRLAIYADRIDNYENHISLSKLIINIIVLIILTFALINFIYPSHLKSVRWLMHLLNIIVIGFVAVDFISLSFFNSVLINGIDISTRFGLLSILVLSLLIPIFTNKSFYCQFVCPFGSLQYISGLAMKKKIRYNKKLAKLLNYVRYFYLLGLLIMIISGIEIILESFEPFSAFAFKQASFYTIIIAIVFVLLAIPFNKPWCRFFCPTGAIFELLRSSIFTKKNNKDEK